LSPGVGLGSTADLTGTSGSRLGLTALAPILLSTYGTLSDTIVLFYLRGNAAFLGISTSLSGLVLIYRRLLFNVATSSLKKIVP